MINKDSTPFQNINVLNSQQTRRQFLGSSSSLLGGSFLKLHLPLVLTAAQTACIRRDESATYKYLEKREAMDLEAIAAQIFPTDDTPGASEAGVIYFIDEALGGFMSDRREEVTLGLIDLNSRHDGDEYFHELQFDAQKILLQSIEETSFFQAMLFLTQVGMFALPSYGGNKNRLGWQLIGFEDRHAWTPPFGFYDADYNKENSS
jgi:gluconate 2-dehydrogenase gamma chain